MPGHAGGLHRRRQGCRRRLRQGHEVQRADDPGAGQVPPHCAGHRRRRLRRRRRRHREGHPRHQLPRHLHRGGGGPRHDAAARHASPGHRAGPHGARGPLDRGTAAAAQGAAPDGADAGLHRLRPGRPRGRRARAAVRPAHAGLRSLPRRAQHLRARRGAGEPLGGAEPLRFHLHAPARHARGRRLPQGAALPADEAERHLHQYRTRPDRQRAGADQGAAGEVDRRRRARRAAGRAGQARQPAAEDAACRFCRRTTPRPRPASIPARKRRVGQELALVLSGRWPMSCVNPTVLPASGLRRWQPISMQRGPNA